MMRAYNATIIVVQIYEDEPAAGEKLHSDKKQRHVDEHNAADAPCLSSEIMRGEPQRDEVAEGV